VLKTKVENFIQLLVATFADGPVSKKIPSSKK
jgi:hypothetical protein